MSGVKPSQFSAATVAAMKTKLGVMTQDEADARYPQITDGDPTPIYTAAEVDLKLSMNPVMRDIINLGIPIKGVPMLSSAFSSANSVLTSGRGSFNAYEFKSAVTLTGIKYLLNAAGVFTANNYNGFVVFSISGGNITEVARTVNDGNVWKATANTIAVKDFAAPLNLAAGIYMIGSMYNSSAQTTAPSIYTLGSTPFNSRIFMPSGMNLAAYIAATDFTSPLAFTAMTSNFTMLFDIFPY